MTRVHVKKCHTDSFSAIRDGRKTFEWRAEDDCRYDVRDAIVLLETTPAGDYTGEVERVRVTYVLRDRFGVPPGYAVLSIERIGL